MNPASNPSIAIPRSRFRQEFDHNTTMLHGDLVPLDCFLVMPGDDYSVHKAAQEIIMSTPIAPIFGNIRLTVCAFFVPMRLVFDKTEEFFGANKTSAGPQTGNYFIPNLSIYYDGVGTNSVSHYLGKPVVASDNTKAASGYGKVSVLKERGYYLIWDSWYRAQQLQAPFVCSTDMLDNVSGIGSIGGSGISLNHDPMKVCKMYDLFTSATISPQYGAAVSLPLGTYAPVIADGSMHRMDSRSEIYFGFENNLNTGFHNVGVLSSGGTNNNLVADPNITSISYEQKLTSSNLVADLSSATAAKINDIRYAFQLQKYLERANFGSRFFEVLAVHYGVTSPDSRLQRPEYLGGKKAPIVVRTVLSQAGYSASTSQQVGLPGASSITYVDLSGLFSKGFVEPGFVYILASTQHERLYSQGLLREDTLFDRFEFYSPEFANLGDQAIKNKEIMLTGDATDEQVFGYQGHWDELRFRKKIVSGLLDPAVSGSLDYWTLAEKYSSRPSLSGSFIQENRDCISRCLVTGSTGPDYITDIFIEYAATRELPLYNIPGLVDHFGAL